MKKSQYIQQKRIWQRNLERITCKSLVWHIVIVTFIMLITLCSMPKATVEKEHISKKASESYSKTTAPYASNLVIFESKAEEKSSETKVNCYPEFTYSKDWSADESYLLAKIAMAEAEGCSIQTKTLIIMTVLNRVWSNEFPDTIEEVIFQKNQFSPIDNGRWDKVEPNDDCWKAVQMVIESAYDYSDGALYFESCDSKDNWHNRNLKFLYESDGLRFYR